MKSILRKVVGFAIASIFAFGMFSCGDGSGDSKKPEKETVATPTFSVESGEVEKGTEVKITCATEGAKIYYTMNGEDPTKSSTEYTDAIKLDAAEIILKAIAVKEGMKDSEIAIAEYKRRKETVAKPAFSVKSGEVEEGTEVKITCATEGAKIFYTTDGSDPTTSSTLYSNAIKIDAVVMTVKAFAVKEEMNDSGIERAKYVRKMLDFPLIKAGTFRMGLNNLVHKVTLSKSFFMCDHEVEQGEYLAVMGANPSYFSNDAVGDEKQEKRPVEQVNWYMAIVYCNKRSMKEGFTPCYKINGKTNPDEWGPIPTTEDSTAVWNAVECDWIADGYRLPTEAEWEYAARAGDDTVDALIWSGTKNKSELEGFAWYVSNSGEKTHEVKKKTGNANKLYDMSGNVWEWCWDCWSGSYSTEDVIDPRGASSDGSYRIRRGGGCANQDEECSAIVHCDQTAASLSYRDVGLRVCRTWSE